MKRILLALALVSSPALADESKPIATQGGDAMRPAAEAYGRGAQELVNKFFAGSKGPMGEAAREREANRGVRHTMKECIKPGNVIDDDVKECTEGLRDKNW